MVQRLLLLTRPGLVTTHWVACQWNLCSTLEWAFPALQDTMTMKCPQNMVKNVAMKGSFWVKVGPCQLALQRLNHDHYKMLTFNTTLRGVQGGEEKIRHSVLWGGNRPSDCQMFSGKDFYEYKFMHLLIPSSVQFSCSVVSMSLFLSMAYSRIINLFLIYFFLFDLFVSFCVNMLLS